MGETARDLLGRSIRNRAPRFQALLRRHDRMSLAGRAERLEYLNSIHPGGTFVVSTEMFHLLDEVKATFVNAEYTATIMLSVAFIEQWLSNVLYAKRFPKEAGSGLKAIIECLRKNRIAHEFVLSRIDRLRLIRNPFTHLKELGHEFGLGKRAFDSRTPPAALLERDAREAVSLLYTVAASKY